MQRGSRDRRADSELKKGGAKRAEMSSLRTLTLLFLPPLAQHRMCSAFRLHARRVIHPRLVTCSCRNCLKSSAMRHGIASARTGGAAAAEGRRQSRAEQSQREPTDGTEVAQNASTALRHITSPVCLSEERREEQRKWRPVCQRGQTKKEKKKREERERKKREERES